MDFHQPKNLGTYSEFRIGKNIDWMTLFILTITATACCLVVLILILLDRVRIQLYIQKNKYQLQKGVGTFLVKDSHWRLFVDIFLHGLTISYPNGSVENLKISASTSILDTNRHEALPGCQPITTPQLYRVIYLVL